MPEDNLILIDRIKQLSKVTGTGVITLSETSVNGFSKFNVGYNHGDFLYYAITDGFEYEVGSGQFILDGSSDAITRSPFASSNNNQLVNFNNGTKEVFATYPGKYSVYSAPFFGSFNLPQKSGVAFWQSENILDYDANFLWDKQNKLLNVSGVKFGDNTVQYTAFTESASFKPYKNISSNYTMLTTDDIIFVNSSSSIINVYIHTAVNFGGKQITIKRSSGNNLVNIYASGSQTIDGQAILTLHSLYQSYSLISNNTNWFIT